MRGIFISYRRDDAEGQAGRLFDDLAAHFGRDAVFMDVAGIKKGLDFRRVIDQHVGSCGVLLVIIGKRWISAVDADGKRRLDDANDFVRLETAAALNRDIPVIPVLVQGAVMPKDHELPDALKELAFRNGTELTHARWDSDVELLIQDLKPYVDLSGSAAKTPATAIPSAPPALPATAAPTTGAGKSRTMWIALVVAALVIGAGALGYSTWRDRAMQEQARVADEKRKADEAAAAQKEAEDKRQRDEADRVAAQKAAEERQRQIDADRAARAAADKAAAEKAAADKAAADRAAAERAAARAAADRAAAEKAAADRAAADKAAADRAAAEKAAADRAAAEKAAADRAAADKAAADRAAAERAAADRAAAARAGTCLSGYVWREAIPTDRVCVTPATRDQVASDNRQAAARRQPGGGAYGPNTCRQGYVWREAYPGDVVCVTPDVRSATARDNAAASSRVVTTTDRVRSSVPSSRVTGN